MSHYRPGIIVLAAIMCLFAGRALGQVIRLPTVLPPEERYPGLLVSHPDSSSELIQSPVTFDTALMGPDSPPDTRPGVFQKLIFNSTWLAPGGNNGFGVSELDLRTVLGFPCPTRSSPLLITPGFSVSYLDGVTVVDLPPRLYDAYAQFRWMSRISPRWAVDLSVTPGVFSDFEQSTDQAVRVTGHGMAAWTYSPNLKFVLGAGYPDREDIKVMPIAGFMWTPYDELKCELIFPRPRIAARVSYTGDVEDWVYVAAEFDNGVWAVRRDDGRNDLLRYRDWRILLGIERKAVGGLDARLELAYVFGRRIQYRSSPTDITPDDTVMLRCGLTY